MTPNTHDLPSLIGNLPKHLSERTWLRSHGRFRRAGKWVLYWTHHALRTDENPALDVAISLAHGLGLPLLVYQGLSEEYRFASNRHHTFILEAARDLQVNYAKLGIPFVVHLDRRGSRLPRLAQLALSSAAVVTEDFPLEATREWTERLAASKSTSVVLVDTACVVPMRLVGQAYDRAFAYREATAKLYRDRVDLVWPKVTTKVEPLRNLPFETLKLAARNLSELVSECDIDHAIGPVTDTPGGSTAGYSRWESFRRNGLKSYAKRRNQIESDGVSRMSAYLHYGMVSPFRIAREASEESAEKFLDELLIWRELAYSFCYFRDDLESDTCLPEWAVATLIQHRTDQRKMLSWETLARAKTGERLWDAAQRSLLKHGELHNNVRMTWGKALFAWSSDHHQTLQRLIDLNHRYALDGRDPASYGGILWCLGQFDRPFVPEQPIFGSVRTRPLNVHEQRTNLAAYERRVDRSDVTPKPRIAMVGAGLGGLMCSRILGDHGLEVQCFEKSSRPGGRTCTRKSPSGPQFDHGAQYFTIRDANLKRYLESWIADRHVAEWHGRIVSIEEPCQFKNVPATQRYVGVPTMESLARHLSTDLQVQFDTEVASVTKIDSGYQLSCKTNSNLGVFDIVLWNCPPMQTAKQITSECSWKWRLDEVEMVPCWSVMLSMDRRWPVDWDGAFVNQGNLSWMARDSSKPDRPSGIETWVFHSTTDWAKANLDMSAEQVTVSLKNEAERVTGLTMPEVAFAKAHRWLYSRPEKSLVESSLWDSRNVLGACGDWCGGPRIEGALKSGISLAGRVLGTLHDHAIAPIPDVRPQQLLLFDDMTPS